MSNSNQWDPYFSSNQAVWNQRVSVHMKSAFYNHAAFMAGKNSLTEIETNALGSVFGKTLLHLQCHFGQDTISWARQGALATGVDFSEEAIEQAREINTQLGLNASFVLSNVYQLPEVLHDKFDIVFSSFGALPWLPDLKKWASIVDAFLKPGGIFYLAEFHPTLYMFNLEHQDRDRLDQDQSGGIRLEYDYFSGTSPHEEEVQFTYADPQTRMSGKEYFWNHSLAETIQPLLDRGLQLQELREFDFSPYNAFPNMKEREPKRFVWGNTGIQMPHVFSIKLLKP